MICGHNISAELRDKTKEYAEKKGIYFCETWSGQEFEEYVRFSAESLLRRFVDGEVFPDDPTEIITFATSDANATQSRHEYLKGTLELLWRARQFAGQGGEDGLWKHAVDFDDLISKGATRTDLRWLLEQRYIESSQFWTRLGMDGRGFRRVGNAVLQNDMCFILTDKGADWAQKTFGLEPECHAHPEG